MAVVGQPIDPRSFDAIRTIVRERSGIVLGDHKQALVSSRLGKRMRALGLLSIRDYVEYLKQDRSGREITELLDAISTNVTSFFREAQHFEYLRDLLLKRPSSREPFRIWCAAASTGEEPYTIAMTVRAADTDGALDARILATDINTDVLKKAMAGEYTEERASGIPRALRDAYFEAGPGSNGQKVYRASDDLRRMIRFRQFNLSTFPYPVRAMVDVVFCRNVMIYFDEQLRRRVVAEFHRLLRPNGILFVGHAECLTGLTDVFATVRPTVYRKTGG